MTLARVTLQPGREKSLAQWHPWVFSGSIAAVEGAPAGGDTGILAACAGTPTASARGDAGILPASDGTPLASAGGSPESKIRARVWSFDPHQSIDAAFFRARVH